METYKVQAEDVFNEIEYIESNKTSQDYKINSSCVKSYLFKDSDRYCRVHALKNGDVFIGYYDIYYNLLNQKIIKAELPIFGGFFEGKNYNYIVWGQKNPDESDSVEVMRVVQYDKLWNKVLYASIWGANTYFPFASGSLRMAEYQEHLYIHTCHRMYKTDDGLCHQSNMTYEILESNMNVIDSYYEISNIAYGYVSHSFNQFIIIDDEANIITLDHGDAYPRAAVLINYLTKAGTSSFMNPSNSINDAKGQKYIFPDVPDYYTKDDIVNLQQYLKDGDAYYVETYNESKYVKWRYILPYIGQIGDNETGASIGGLEYSDSSYITAGNSIVQKMDTDTNLRNIYLSVTDRNTFDTNIKWITNYCESDGITASTPHLVKIKNNK